MGIGMPGGPRGGIIIGAGMPPISAADGPPTPRTGPGDRRTRTKGRTRTRGRVRVRVRRMTRAEGSKVRVEVIEPSQLRDRLIEDIEQLHRKYRIN